MGYRSIVISSAVRILIVTEKQYEAIKILVGKRMSEEARPADEQISFF